jgi:hypothetical protein
VGWDVRVPGRAPGQDAAVSLVHAEWRVKKWAPRNSTARLLLKQPGCCVSLSKPRGSAPSALAKLDFGVAGGRATASPQTEIAEVSTPPAPD